MSLHPKMSPRTISSLPLAKKRDWEKDVEVIVTPRDPAEIEREKKVWEITRAKDAFKRLDVALLSREDLVELYNKCVTLLAQDGPEK